MKHSCLHSEWIFVVFFEGILLLCMTSGLKSAEVPAFANETDRLALLDFKNQISQDPLHIMSSWNNCIHFCNWLGVTCSPYSKRVMVLNLEARKLAGSVPPSVGNLTYLTGINLRRNSFYGEIPQEMGLLRHLQHLNLSFNSFGGKLPANLSQCAELRLLHVAANKLIGRIPDQFSSLSKLTHLNLAVNNFTGTIPTWIGNFSSLCFLDLQVNNFQGSIPNELGRLSGLGFFQLYGNNLSGTIPPQIYNISSIYCFTFTQNRLHGILPSDVGLTLPNLEIFAGGVNSFTGPIPVSLSNASRLQILDFAENGLTGGVPQSLSGLPGLVRLNMDDNWLGNGKVGGFNFLSFLANCTALKVLGLARNQFGGVLPSSIANLSTQLSRLTMGGNMIHGGIPTGIGKLFNLNSLGLEFNYLGGHLPDSLGKLQNLEGLYLNVNRFSGIIPSSFGNLTRLTKLFMEENTFEGSIPSSLANCQNLLQLNLSSNNLNGTIPKQVIGLSSFSISLVMSHNHLIGTLPFEVGNLENLAELDLSGNRLSGDIPPSLGSCVGLERLHLEGNSFEGAIPESLKTLRSLEEMDLSRNNLSGQIPQFLAQFPSLKYLNLSYNDLEGNVPSEGIFNNTTAISLFGNDKLCGGIPALQLTTCSRKSSGSSGKVLALRVAIPITSIIIFSIVLLYFCSSCSMMKNSRKRPLASSSSTDRQLRVSYAELLESTNSFSADNLIGSGSFGTVYKGVLPSNGAIVAIKVLNLQLHGASKSFIDECNALRSIRHRNLLKIVTACSSIDHQGKDFKCLVYEFMSNGSLDQWLHPKDDERHESKRLSFVQRLNIAIDVACALEYLHRDCQTPIVHCDIKPSNILLDEDWVAHVGDFGLAKFLLEASRHPDNSSEKQTMSAGLKGSVGYIPPEYGMVCQVSVVGDIYSYGILLLEMFTGKRPTDDIFRDGLDIHRLTEMALPEHVMDIVDPSMPLEEDGEDADFEKNEDYIEESAIIEEADPRVNVRSKIQDCLVSVLRIGLFCSSTSPDQRMQTNVVVNQMQAARDSFLRFKKGK